MSSTALLGSGTRPCALPLFSKEQCLEQLETGAPFRPKPGELVFIDFAVPRRDQLRGRPVGEQYPRRVQKHEVRRR